MLESSIKSKILEALLLDIKKLYPEIKHFSDSEIINFLEQITIIEEAKDGGNSRVKNTG